MITGGSFPYTSSFFSLLIMIPEHPVTAKETTNPTNNIRKLGRHLGPIDGKGLLKKSLNRLSIPSKGMGALFSTFTNVSGSFLAINTPEETTFFIVPSCSARLQSSRRSLFPKI